MTYITTTNILTKKIVFYLKRFSQILLTKKVKYRRFEFIPFYCLGFGDKNLFSLDAVRASSFEKSSFG